MPLPASARGVVERDREPVLSRIAVAVLDEPVERDELLARADAVEDVAAFLRGAPVRVLNG
jgi:hypothetical protein